MANYAIVTAAGKGERMKAEKNKCLLKLGGKELLLYCLREFEQCGEIDKVVVVAAEHELKEMRQLLHRQGLEKTVSVVAGGKQRQDSVWNGLKEAERIGAKEEDVVVIHDGARPFVSQEAITESISSARKHGAAVVGVALKDTIKKVSGEMVLETPNRKEYFAVQTPQTIRFGLAKKAFKKAFAEGFYGTDDVQLVERIGESVKIVSGSYENIKITTPEDIPLAEKILEKRGKM